MTLEMLKSKLHMACITDGNVLYEGSLGIDVELMEAVGLLSFEKILVANVNNGNRFETYAIPEPFGSRKIVLNGAAARLGVIGDRIIIMSFCRVDADEVQSGRFHPRAIRLDENNDPVQRLFQSSRTDGIAAMLGR